QEGTQKTTSIVLTSAGGENAFQAIRLPAVFDQALILYRRIRGLSSVFSANRKNFSAFAGLRNSG
ncbi:MAG: hypothetical protein ACOYIE_05260, partial [Agathobaculum sp.]|uniref:hypothetical protein n=1 Tax=Agathobaculum sp. TaxID=2048138 RepID=UPI003D8B8141